MISKSTVSFWRHVAEFIALAAILFAMLMLSSCKHRPLTASGDDDEEVIPTGGGNGGTGGTGGTTGVPCDPDTVYFQNTILPLFVSNCAKSGCHDPGTAKEGFIFNSYSGIMGSGEITPFKPWEGDITEVITETDPDKIMPPPPNAPLTSQQVSLIVNWISQGALNNGCDQCDTLNVTYSGKVKPIIDLKCKGCHSGSAPPNGIDLTGHAGLQAIALSGKLMGSVNHLPGYSAMPKGGSMLPDCERNAIKKWVDSGALNN